MQSTARNLLLLVTCAFVPAASGQSFAVDIVPTQAADLVWDSVSVKLYATTQSSVVPIDPFAHVVGTPVIVGSQSTRLAISDDGQYLYVGFDGLNAVKRVHVPTQVVDLTIPLGNDPFFGPLYAEDIAVQPANPTVIAVSRKRFGVSPRHGGVAVFDGAVQRPDTTPGHTGSNVIEWTDASNTVVGYNNETTDFSVRTMLVNAQGVSVVQALATAINGFGLDIKYSQGVLYATNGVAVDPLSGLTVGIYTGTGSNARVAVNPAQDRVYYVSGSTLRTYSRSTFQLITSQALPGVQGSPLNLVRWGNESLAFSTTNGQVVILTGNENCTSSWSTTCPAVTNTTGLAAAIDLTGSLSIQDGEATLHCSNLPHGISGRFLMGRHAASLPFGNGLLCIDIFSGIYRVPGIVHSGQTGAVALPIPFSQLTAQYGFQAGTSWRFQFWFRDSGGAGSNLSDVAVATFCP